MKQKVMAFVLGAAWMAVPARAQQDGIPALDHVFVIVLENHGYADVIGNSNAPVINTLAETYNSALDYNGVRHPSLPNYLAMVSGDDFGVSNDEAPVVGVPPGPWSFNAVTIGSQLEAVGKDWRTYQEDIPATGSLAAKWPGDAHTGSIYVVKHNPFPYFQIHQAQDEFNKMVPITELFSDLAGDEAPALSYIVPNMCNNMHGQDFPLSPCSGYDDAALISRGDHETGLLVKAITGSSTWEEGRCALFIVFDEAEDKLSTPLVALAITNYGVKGVQDSTHYTHYSLLKTIEAGFGLSYLGHAADAGTQSMAPMLAGATSDKHGSIARKPRWPRPRNPVQSSLRSMLRRGGAVW
jgi:phosphoesterase family protein